MSSQHLLPPVRIEFQLVARVLRIGVCCMALGCTEKRSASEEHGQGLMPDAPPGAAQDVATKAVAEAPFEPNGSARDPFEVDMERPTLAPEEVERMMIAVDRKPDPVEVARLLKANPALVHARTKRHSNTLLHLAVLNDDLAIAEVLLAGGAPVDARNSSASCFGTAETPLHWAAKSAFPEMTRLLLASGADPTAKVLSHGEEIAITALYYALGRDDDGVTRIGEEFEARRKKTAKILLEAGAKE